jgi:AraC family transcriptional regulator
MTDAQTARLTPRFAEGDPMRVIGLGERYEAMTSGRLRDQWARLQERLGDVRGRADPAQFGLFYQLSENPFAFDYLTGVMVDDDAPLPSSFVERRLPARRHAVFTHQGDVSGLRPLVHAIFRDWLPRSGQAAVGDPDFVVVYGEEFDPVRLQGVIEVWVPLED